MPYNPSIGICRDFSTVGNSINQKIWVYNAQGAHFRLPDPDKFNTSDTGLSFGTATVKAFMTKGKLVRQLDGTISIATAGTFTIGYRVWPTTGGWRIALHASIFMSMYLK